MIDPLLMYQVVILIILLSLLGLLLINLLTLPNADCEPPHAEPPDTQHATRNTQHATRNAHSACRVPHAAFVSILVPARNEAENIEACVRSLLAQDYPHFEVIVLDDQSEDGTGAILARLAAQDGRLRVLAGGPVRPGWLGKANACRQLAEAAGGAWLLFTDADTRHRPPALRCALALAQARRVGLLSMFPRQITPTLIERLVVPLMHLAVYGLLPLPLMRRLRHPAFAAANGQFMLLARAAYEAAGGHAAVRALVLEDVALARAVKRAGHRIELADGGDLVQTRMYATPAALWAGFSKNFFAFFNDSLPFLAAGLLGFALLYVLPPLWLLAGVGRAAIIGLASAWEIWAWVGLPLLQYGCGVTMRLLLGARFRFHPAGALLHPLAVALQIAIGVNSARLARRGGASWKGRRVQVMSDE
jgi:chlorobactene glucosyltransferase